MKQEHEVSGRPAEEQKSTNAGGNPTCLIRIYACKSPIRVTLECFWRDTSFCRVVSCRRLSGGTVCVRAAEHPDDGDSLAFIVNSVEHAVGAAAGTVAVVQRWS